MAHRASQKEITRMNIPDTVKIGGYNYNVTKSEIVLNQDNEVCYGTHDFTNLQINIASKYIKQVQDASFLHEIIHGISDIYHLNLKEDMVGKLGDALYQVIIDNPDMFKEV
jgi:glycogen debranching enzyme